MEKVRFGIIGAGTIATKFALSAKVAQKAEVTSVASRSLEKAQQFAAQYNIPKAVGSYEELYQDKDVDAVYIATPHNLHKGNCLDAIAHGKHILCEKPLTLTKADAEEIYAKAAAKGVFIMEAMWTRFIPTMVKAKEWISEGRIGDIKLVSAAFGFNTPENPEGRLFNKALAGGALYDIGVYVLEFMQDFTRGKKLLGFKTLTLPTGTGVDGTDVMSFAYEGGTLAQLYCSIQCSVDQTGFVYGDKGYIKFSPYFFAPRKVELCVNREVVDSFEPTFNIGYEFEISHAAQCILDGKRTSDIMPPQDTIDCAAMFEALLADMGYTK